MNVSLYRCFKSDKRISMDVYADGLKKALETKNITPTTFTPVSKLEHFNHNPWVMRYLRYQSYPYQVRKNKHNSSGIHHVTDHGYAHLLTSLRSGIKVLTVHDLIPLLAWQGDIKKQDGGYFSKRKPRLNLHSLKFIKRYDHIVAISKSTANDLSACLDIDADTISIIPPVISQNFSIASEESVQALRLKYRLSQDVKWLMVSGSEFYKNHQTSLLVLKEIIQNMDVPVKLIKTGKPSAEFNVLVDELGLSESVITLFLTDTSELPILYTLVDCFLFPSIYEGFGMPVAEALACGTPVVTSDRASLPEVGGELAIQCDAYDVMALSKSVIDQLNSVAKQDIRKRGPLWVNQFREQKVGSKLAGLYRSLT